MTKRQKTRALALLTVVGFFAAGAVFGWVIGTTAHPAQLMFMGFVVGYLFQAVERIVRDMVQELREP